MDESTLAELKAKHGPIAVVRSRGDTLVFKTPAPADWEHFQDRIHAGKGSRSALFREIAIQSVVHPSVDELTRIFENRPALPANISNHLADLAGADLEVEVKKE